MRIFDKYILKNIISTYILILLLFISLYFVIDALTNLSDILKAKTPFYIVAQYYLNFLPLIIRQVNPLAIIIATLYTFGELNKNNEIISLRVSGISVLRISLPVIFFAVLVSSLTLFMQEKILIHSQKKVNDINTQFIKKQSLTAIAEEQNLNFTSGNMIFFVNKFVFKDKNLKGVIIFEENNEGGIVKKINCQDIIYQEGSWIGKNVIEYEIDEKGNPSGTPAIFDRKEIALADKPQELIFKKSIYSEFYSLHSLRKRIKNLERIKASQQRSNLIVDYHRKIAEAFESLFLVIGILPLALEIKRRKVALSSLGIGVLFYFLYYTTFYFSVALGKSGIIIPFLSGWLAPLFFLTVGISGIALIK